MNIKNNDIQKLFEYQKQQYSKVILIKKTIFKTYLNIKNYNIQKLNKYCSLIKQRSFSSDSSFQKKERVAKSKNAFRGNKSEQ